jgi:hypothetical protein
MTDEQEAIIVILDEHTHGRHQQQLLPDQCPEPPHVVGHGHGERVGGQRRAAGFVLCPVSRWVMARPGD